MDRVRSRLALPPHNRTGKSDPPPHVRQCQSTRSGFYKSGFSSRAFGAHINGIETFPFFAAAVLLAEFRAQPQHWVDILALGYLVIRLGYVAAYLGNWPTTRTLVWNAGFAMNTAIFFMPLWRSA